MGSVERGRVQWYEGDNWDDGQMPRYEMLRTGKRGFKEAIVVSNGYEVCPTHFIGNRTMPCTGNGCEGCLHGRQIRVKIYTMVCGIQSRTIYCFEATDFSKQNFFDYKRLNGTMRGAILKCHRTGPRKNSPVRVEFSKSIFPDSQLPVEDRTRDYLERLWGILNPLTAEDQVANHIHKMAAKVNNPKRGRGTNGQAQHISEIIGG